MPRRSARWHTALALLAFLLYAWCARQQGRVGDLAPGEGPTSFPARVAGHEVHSVAEARFAAGAVEPGREIRVEDARGARAPQARHAVAVGSLLISLLVAFAFGAACLFAFAGRAETEPARSFFWGSFGYGLAIATGGVHAAATPGSAVAVSSLLRIASVTLTPLLLLRVAQVFPRPARWPASRVLWITLLVVGVAITLFHAVAYLDFVRAASASAYARLQVGERLADVWIVGVAAAGATLVWRNSRATELARERRQAKWVAWGVGAGMMPFVLLYVLPRALGTPELLPLDIVRLCALAVPAAFAIAVVRHQFMDIDVIIRRSLIYATLAALLTALYLAIGLFLGGRLGEPGEPSVEAARLTAAALAIALFFPTRRAIGAWVDRTFFGLRAGNERALRDFRDRMREVVDPDEWARTLATFLRGALGLRRVLVVYAGASGARAHWATGDPSGAPADEAARRAVAFLAGSPDRAAVTTAAPGQTGSPEIEQDGFAPELGEAGLVVLRPLAGSPGPLGCVALGGKEIERRFIEPDLVFIDAVATEASGALERLLLVRRAAEDESRVRRQEEIDRRKGEFLAQVAHDLQTPLTSILWSSQNLLDGVLGPLGPDAAAAVGSIRTAGSYVSRLVANLVALARLDDGALALTPEPVPLLRTLAAARSALLPLAQARDVRIEFAGDSGAEAWPPARSDRDGLMKIAVNLLDNAIKYAPAGSAITLRLDRPSPGWQSFAVEDHGPGVPPAHRARIFERYARAPAAGDGARPGFGLGLFVARVYLEGVGGSIAMTETPGGGATFTCRLRESDAGGREVSWPGS